MKTAFLSSALALAAAGAQDAANVAAITFDRIDRAINANVCDNYDDDMDGDFDVVGDDEELGARGGRGGRGGYGRSPGRGGAFRGHPGSRGAQRGPQVQRGQHPRQAGGGYNFPPGTHVPPWLRGAYGVHGPSEQLHVLPLQPETNNGVFTSAIANIQYSARPQKPFRGERLVTQLIRAGASAAAVLPESTGIFVGVDLQQVEQGNIPVETWPVTAFGVRLAFVDCLPGILIKYPVTLVGALAVGDTITLLVTLLGRVLAG
jgi:hypothetical protein